MELLKGTSDIANLIHLEQKQDFPSQNVRPNLPYDESGRKTAVKNIFRVKKCHSSLILSAGKSFVFHSGLQGASKMNSAPSYSRKTPALQCAREADDLQYVHCSVETAASS